MSASDEIYQWLIAPIETRMMLAVTRLVRDPDEAADAFQNALAQIWRDLEKIRRHPSPRAYILRVCISAAYDALRQRSRRRRREVPLENEPARSGALTPEALSIARLIAAERREAALAAIATLPAKQAQALLLRAIEDQSYATIAEVLGCSEATARSHVSKARERLCEILDRPQAAGEARR